MAGTADPSFGAVGLRMFWGLLVVLGILLIVYGFARKKLSLVHSSKKSKIKIIEMRPLMAKKSLCLVEVAGRQYLLGLGSETITLLSTVETNESHNFSATLETAAKQHEQNRI
ncbi:MAG: flagellar biosynthetic protein FliO [Proteobacteria bacterium]|nr:flagellar biosynthetic protein FliO [Pseudomonadota bacterium]MBU1232265.1 flagellar biosynthetic protein FliO [Pseudomonadota bacterium]MBU1416946.1 flagellar biosynthetic protein FliO [Pseudomonadota bacterium]MBU1456681.1 flagellar biosynthetic protein FliO [Pseudomonadota bacterium]